MKHLRYAFRACFLAAVAALSHASAGEVTRAEALQTAEAYRVFAWTPSERNVFHGDDPAGIRVDTPDQAFRRPGTRPGWWQPGAPNIGVPYKWGGFDSLEQFARGIAEGKPAGDVYTPEKRRQLDRAISNVAAGIDCSGLISRCFKLERSYSTRELPALCLPLASYDELRPADILNTENQHVLLFKSWKDPAHRRLYAYETGAPPGWKVLLDDIPVTLLQSQKYRAFRYRHMRD